MRRTSTSAIGAFHPIMFFIVVYSLSVLMALFVCRSVYISIYGDPDLVHVESKTNKDLSFAATTGNMQVTALR
ncbi:MAG TPA: hypothetical protein VEZ55_08370 [Chitinophagaceae bacterium]|jgi:hypothetical protein|nr:hypothetical protein [Chitinophagaceae bacterium]